MIKMIVASTKDGLIGSQNHLPWNIPEELHFFKEMTMGHTLLWGRKTFVNLPKKLLGRHHYVVTKMAKIINADGTLQNSEAVYKFMHQFEKSAATLFICGGKTIYEQFYQMATEIYWTEIKQAAQGDTYLKLDLSNYRKSFFLQHKKFTIYKYVKIDDKK